MSYTKEQLISIFGGEFSEFHRNYPLHIYIANKPNHHEYLNANKEESEFSPYFLNMSFKETQLLPDGNSDGIVTFTFKWKNNEDDFYDAIEDIYLHTINVTHSQVELLNALYADYESFVSNFSMEELYEESEGVVTI